MLKPKLNTSIPQFTLHCANMPQILNNLTEPHAILNYTIRQDQKLALSLLIFSSSMFIDKKYERFTNCSLDALFLSLK